MRVTAVYTDWEICTGLTHQRRRTHSHCVVGDGGNTNNKYITIKTRHGSSAGSPEISGVKGTANSSCGQYREIRNDRHQEIQRGRHQETLSGPQHLSGQQHHMGQQHRTSKKSMAGAQARVEEGTASRSGTATPTTSLNRSSIGSTSTGTLKTARRRRMRRTG
jgi:hypothetical protein